MMEDLLIHTSDKKVDILKPNKISEWDKPCICFSLNQFVSFFGEYIYLFQKKILEENFFVEKVLSKGVGSSSTTYFKHVPTKYRYRSEDLGYEFRVYQPIDAQRYCLGIITNFNHLKGVLERKINEKITREYMDFSLGE